MDYPLYYRLIDIFVKGSHSLSSMRDQYQSERAVFKDISTLGVFMDNHDVNRIMNQLGRKYNKDESKAVMLNIMTYIYMSYGIPIFYYGTEDLFSGGSDPENREVFDPLVRHKPLVDRTVVLYLKTLNEFRRSHQTYNLPIQWRLTESKLLTFNKGHNLYVIISSS